ncbi:MAG TPA: type II toxin-antitoxin system Phd/YefM family antitoxin [Candidatus Hydrogenedentes bacterium]|nr:type II toxin-antitoxin system Phd/YefM family antitoxin [Candidatus Hydrogenedentota bacterium]
MTHVNTESLPNDLSKAIGRVIADGERIVLELGGVAKAGLVPMEDLELLQRIEDYIDNQKIEAAIAEGGEDIPWEVVKKALDL